jgi:hypothetical protein
MEDFSSENRFRNKKKKMTTTKHSWMMGMQKLKQAALKCPNFRVEYDD